MNYESIIVINYIKRQSSLGALGAVYHYIIAFISTRHDHRSFIECVNSVCTSFREAGWLSSWKYNFRGLSYAEPQTAAAHLCTTIWQGPPQKSKFNVVCINHSLSDLCFLTLTLLTILASCHPSPAASLSSCNKN